jgi:GcrA cell cycle regulator
MSGSREASVQWKPEWIEVLRGHLAAGLSATEAAGEINSEFDTRFSRCAIIGKAKREKIPLRAGKGGRIGPKGGPSQRKPRIRASTKQQRPDIAIRKSAKRKPTDFSPYNLRAQHATLLRCDPVNAGTLHLLELETGMCRYPTGEGADMKFCGRWQVDGKPYCPEHCEISYRNDRRAA